MKKTYTIYVTKYGENGEPISEFKPMFLFQSGLKSYTQGGMDMAKAFYGERYEFVMKCDQTDEEIDHVYPRKIHVN